MKNTFKAFGLMLLAGTLMLASCGKKDENTTTTNPVTGKPQYKIEVQANDANMGTVTGAGTYDSAATVTLTASANAGYEFVNWTTPEGTSTHNPLTFAAKANASYTANFQAQVTTTVTVGNESWTPNFMNAQMASNAIMLAFGKTASNELPICNIVYSTDGSLANGTYTDSPSMEEAGDGYVNIYFGSPRVWYFESGPIALDDTPTGDWWGKSVNLSISNLDATALIADVVVNATLVHFAEMFDDEGYLTTIDFNNPTLTTKPFTASFTGQQFTASSKNLTVAKKAIARIAR